MTYPPLRPAPEPDDFDDLRKELSSTTPTPSKLAPLTWKPQEECPGAELAGTIVAVEEVEGQWGSKPVLTIETQDGPRKVWASHSVLKSALEGRPPAPGSRILVRYDGTKTSAAGHDYHVYAVAVDTPLPVPPGQTWVQAFNSASKPAVTPVASDDLPF